MSFDLLILINKTDIGTQKRWLEKLKNVGIDCQFPKDFAFGETLPESSEISIRYKLIPPLVKVMTQQHTFECQLEPWKIDAESKNDYLESIENTSLQQKITSMTTEVQFSTSAGRDDHALILQCFAAATLADACDGILVDPQEFGAVSAKEMYQVAQYHCQHEIDKLAKAKTQANQDTRKEDTVKSAKPPHFFAQLFKTFQSYFKTEAFSPYANSVRAEWLHALYVGYGNFTLNQEIDKMGLKQYKDIFEKQKLEDFTFQYGPFAFECGLKLRLKKRHKAHAEYYFDACKELSHKIYPFIQTQNKNSANQPDKLINSVGLQLETFLTWACAININQPEIPDKEKLREGVLHYHETYSALKSKTGYLGAEENSITFLVMALLADEYEIAKTHINRCKKDPETKKHRAILGDIINRLTNKNKFTKIIIDESLEKQFFELFNGYRLPNKRLTNEFIGDYSILSNPISNYVFAWLYLKLFKGQTESTWKELRHIMMW